MSSDLGCAPSDNNRIELSESHQIKLTDFSLTSSYLDSTGSHVPEELRETFIGNMHMGSVNAMRFKSPSRRDDLISLCYLLVLMIQGYVGFLNDAELKSRSQEE